MRERWPLFLILALFAGWCVAFNAATPYRQGGVLLTARGAPAPDIGAPDERQHANYIAALLRGDGFPVLRPGAPDLYETYQAHQPPLYYLLAAGWATLVGADPQDPGAGFRLRLLSTLLGLGTLLGVFWAARWASGRDDVGYASTAFVGLLPMFIALHAAVSNDPLLYLVCTWTLALCIRFTVVGWTLKGLLSVGALIGLGLLTKTTALALLPLAAVALLLGLRRFEPGPLRLGALGALFVLPLAIAAPWLARNMQLYGDPLAISVFGQAFVGSPPASAFVQEFGLWAYLTDFVGWWTGRSFFGTFGYMDIFMLEGSPAGPWLYRLLILLTAALMVVGFIAMGRQPVPTDEEAPDPRAARWLCLALVVMVSLLFLRFNLQYFQAQARYLYPAIAAFGLLSAAGVVTVSGRFRGSAWAGVAVALTVLDVVAYAALTQGFARRVIGG